MAQTIRILARQSRLWLPINETAPYDFPAQMLLALRSWNRAIREAIAREVSSLCAP